MKNKLFKTSICTLLLFSMLIFPAENISAKLADNIEFNNITYIVDKDNGTVIVEGEGTFNSFDNPLSHYEEYFHQKLTHWIIGEGITRIQDMTDCSGLYMESIQLPESLQIIDENAFFSCVRLKNIVIPQGVKMIHKNAFKGCNRLKTVTNLSDQTIYLPNHPSFGIWQGTIYDYYVDGKAAVTVPPGKTAVGQARKYMVALDIDGGTLSNYDKHRDIYFQSGEPLKLPKPKKKGYIFCGWTARPFSNIAWFTITGEDTDNPDGSTFFWDRTIKLYAQYAKVTTKKIGKRKLNLNVSKWRDASQLEIQYSTNKKYENAKSIIVKNSITILGKKKNKKKHYVLNYNKKKRTLSITLSKLKAKKNYYFRFQYHSECIGASCDIYIAPVGDWFKKSVKM